MSELEEYLENQTDSTAESGEFTINPERARQLVTDFSKLYPGWGLIRLFQSFVLGECHELQIQVGKDDLRVEASLSEVSELYDGRKLMAAIGRGEFSETAQGLMISALLAFAAQGPRVLRLRTPTGTLHYDGTWHFHAQNSRCPLTLEWTPTWSRFERISRRFEWLSTMARICRFYPLPVRLDGRPLEKDWLKTLVVVCKMFVAGGGLRVQRTKLQCYEESSPGVFLYARDAHKFRTQGSYHPCTVLWRGAPSRDISRAICLGTDPEPVHHLARHGVIIKSIPLGKSLGWTRYSELGVSAVTDVTHLATDASGVELVKDERYHKFAKGFWADVLWASERYMKHHCVDRSTQLRRDLSNLYLLEPLHWLTRALSKTAASVYSLQAARRRHAHLRLLAKEEI